MRTLTRLQVPPVLKSIFIFQTWTPIVRNRRKSNPTTNGFANDGFDVDDFIQRMTSATGLDVKHVQAVGEETTRITLKTENG